MYIYIYIYRERERERESSIYFNMFLCIAIRVLCWGVFLFDPEESSGPDGMLCVVLWRPEALDCRVLILPPRGDQLGSPKHQSSRESECKRAYIFSKART